MKEILEQSAFFGVTISLLFYGFGVWLKKKLKWGFLNPLLISIVLVILFLAVFHIDYEDYKQSAQPLSYLLTPATVCLAIPLYEQMEILKKNYKAVFAGVISGVLSSMFCVLGLAFLFGLSHKEYVTLLPKSITTAIGIGLSEELGGIVPLTTAVIIMTGVLGNVTALGVCKLFRIEEPVAKGIGIGSAAHAVGTARAMEIGEIEGAMSSLSIVVTGLLTVIAASVFAQFL